MNVGQVCVAGTRILVQDTIAEEFTAEFTKLMSAVKVGDPFDPSTTQGPLVSAPHWDRVNGWVKIACEDGATLALGGKDLREELGGGYYISPTIFTGVKKENRVLANEVFGPVVSIQTFSTEEEAIEEANRTSYGLASAVFSNNYERIQRMNDAIRAGTVWNNIYNFTSFAIPFGGYKESGIGREVSHRVCFGPTLMLVSLARPCCTTTSRPRRSSATWGTSAHPWLPRDRVGGVIARARTNPPGFTGCQQTTGRKRSGACAVKVKKCNLKSDAEHL